MKQGLLLIVGFLFCAFLSAQDLKSIRINGAECANGHIIIKFKRDFTDASGQDVTVLRQNLISKYRSTVKKQWKMKAELWQIDTLQMPKATQTILDSLKKLPYVQYAEPDFIVKADMIPNDPSFPQQWALHNTGQNGGTPGADIKAPEAWDITTGDTNIVVGVIDSGIDYLHPDLAANIWTNWDEIPNNGIDDDNNGYIDDFHGWDFFNNDNNPMDDYFHGTHVAGTIGAVANNGIGVVGVAWKVRMMALKFLGSNGSGPTSGAVSAVEYATANGAKITNNSWGGGGYSQALYDAIAEADSVGVLFIAAAGNDASNNDINISYPSGYNIQNIISVASTDRSDQLSGFSNWGFSSVDIAAPGSEILSTTPSMTYGMLSGTSMATPNISGAAALVASVFPGFSNRQIKMQLMGTVDTISRLQNKLICGGRLNLNQAVRDTSFFLFTTDKQTLSFGVQRVDSTSESQYIKINNLSDVQIVVDSIWITEYFPVSLNNVTFQNKLYSINILPDSSVRIYIRFHPIAVNRYADTLKIFAKYCDKHHYSIVKGFGISTSGTVVNQPFIEGDWIKANSPYYITTNVQIEIGKTLRIHPGVKVLFSGYYSLNVIDNSLLIAKGAVTDSIIFSALDEQDGWAGIQISNNPTATDSLEYFKLNLVRNVYYYGNIGGAINAKNVNLVLKHCEIFDNIGQNGGGILFGNGNYNFKCLFVHGNSAIHNNGVGIGGGICSALLPLTNATIDSLVLENNYASSGGGGLYFWQGNFILRNIKVNSNGSGYNSACAFNQCNINIKNILISNNSSNDNEACTFQNSISFTQNLTFVNNNGHVKYHTGQNKLKNAIFYNNSLPEIKVIDYNGNPALLSISYVNLSDSLNSILVANSLVTTNNIIYGNPSFLSPSDFHLAQNSKCIDKGDPSDPVGLEPFPHGYRINLGNFGGTYEATTSSGLAINIFPNPVDFGLISASKDYIDTLRIMNGGIIDAILSDVISEDTTHIKLMRYTINDTIHSGEIYPVHVDFIPNFPSDTVYQTYIDVSILNKGIQRIPIIAKVFTGSVIDSQYVYGNWYKSNSPYKITRDIQIPPYYSLHIESGVKVFFGGNFVFEVGQNAQLVALGTNTDSIYFKPYMADHWGGISFNDSDADDSLIHVIITKGVNLFGDGGGIRLEHSSPKMEHITMSKCLAFHGGAIYSHQSSLNILGGQFEDNGNNTLTDLGGAIYSVSSKLALNEVNFLRNHARWGGGAIYFDFFTSQDTSFLHANRILGKGNTAGWVGSFLCGGSGQFPCIISNSVFTSDTSGSSVISSRLRTFKLINVTLANNYAYPIESTSPENSISNCILWNNRYNQVYFNWAKMSVENSDIQGGQGAFTTSNGLLNWGLHNKDTIPCFADSILQLAANSHCNDAGTNDSVVYSTDLSGNVRIWDGNSDGFAKVDMGAYEYGAPAFLPGISGHYYYNNTANIPLDSVAIGLKLNGVKIDSTYSNGLGSYQFLQKAPGTYTMTTAYYKPWNGVNGTDALKVQRHFAGLEVLTEPIRLQAADVNASGSINGTDALKIKRRFAGLDTTFAAGDWTFAKPTVGGNTVSVQDENVVQNFYGLCVGDVNGSFVPGPGAKSSSAVSLAYKPSIEVHPGQEFLLPVTVDQASDVSALSLVLKFPEEKIRIQDVRMHDGREVVFRQFANEVRMAWSEVTPLELNRGDTLLTIYCKVAGELVKDELIYPEITSETELADRSAKVISGSTLNINPIQLKTGKLPDNAPNSENDGLQIIPNPHTGQFIIQTNATFSGIGEVRIFDNTGKKIYSNTAIRFNQGKSGTLKMNDLEAGVYLIELKSEDSEFKATMIIK